MEKIRSYKQFDGFTNYYRHDSKVCDGPMQFAAFIPPHAKGQKLPVLYWLSGLTCTEENFITKAYAQLFARKFGFVVVAPDTSPRSTGIPGEAANWDIGTGAGFYVDATEKKWARHFRMFTYVTEELRELVEKELPIDPGRRAISGHSMGGHGALVLGLRRPDLYRSISAFSPICAPSKAPWGLKAFLEYLGQDRSAWAQYDANELVKSATMKIPMLLDQGLDDEFLAEQLFTDEFERTCRSAAYPATIRRQAGYDHSYFFISTFIEQHFAFHAEALKSR